MPLDGKRYVLKRQLLKIFGEGFGIYDERGTKVLQADEPPFRWKREIGLRGLGVEPLLIQANSIADFAARYDVFEGGARTKIGALQRKWLHSFLRDEWTVLDAWDRPVGQVVEDSQPLAALRRFGAGLIPQNYDLFVNGQKVMDLRQNFNPFTYHLRMDFLVPSPAFNRRLGIAAAVLLGAVEGRQRSELGAVGDLVDLARL